MSFWCLQISQKYNEIFVRISCLASKKRSNQKKWEHFIPLSEWFYFDSLTLLLWFDLFLESRAEILEFFFKDLKTPKGHFEINWPLTIYRVIYCKILCAYSMNRAWLNKKTLCVCMSLLSVLIVPILLNHVSQYNKCTLIQTLQLVFHLNWIEMINCADTFFWVLTSI